MLKIKRLLLMKIDRHVLSCSFIKLFGLLIKRMMLLAACVASSCPMGERRCR